jgi:hypothetical protein
MVTEGSSPKLRDFEVRRNLGFGQYLTTSEIDRLSFASTTDLLETFHSVTVGSKEVLNIRGFGFQTCPLRVFVDGVAVAPHNLDADLPPPGQLAGIELYVNSATVPPQYAAFGGIGGRPGGAVCGVILLWTKS